jgi:hypothetical protein
MSKTNDGGPVFPQSGAAAYRWSEQGERPGQLFESAGMSLRDWFAGQALIGMSGTNGMDDIAERAYLLADAMLKAREAAL